MSKPRSNSQTIRAMSARARQRGVSLIELMVAMVIGLVLIGGAIQVYLLSRQNYDVNETAVRLQENARYALSIIEPDVRMANSWGLLKGFIEVAPSGYPETNCGVDFASNARVSLDGSNNQYNFGCPARGGAVTTADTLIVRRAFTSPATATEGQLLVCSTRTQAQLVMNSAGCTPAPIGQVNNLSVNGYYIARDSNRLMNMPTLRRYAMSDLSDPEQLDDIEILQGVEDMQVQFGIDPTGTSGEAARYVNAGEVPEDAQVVSVRIWLLIRAETPEPGFTDEKPYEYGDRLQANGETGDLNDPTGATFAYRPVDHFRRLLVSRTILIRNALGT